jgi:hypothetical protein
MTDPRQARAARNQQESLDAFLAEKARFDAVVVELRGFFAGLKKLGVTVAVLERVRQVEPNKAGPKGSYTVYGITG